MINKTTIASMLTILLMAGVASADCLLSEDIDNFVMISEGDLTVSFGTNGSVFEVTDTVKFELVVTNTGASTAVVDFPVHDPEAVLVADVDCPDIQNCSGPFRFIYPDLFYYVPGSYSIEPGECMRWTVFWDLVAEPAPVGTYKAWGGLLAWTDGQYRLPIGEWLVPGDGALLFLELVEAVAADDFSWSRVKAMYR